MEKYNYRIGILREEGDDWERRVPLTPDDCKTLLSENLKILLQPSEIRCYSDEEYKEAGCIICENLEECDLILGINILHESKLIKDKTYLLFAKAHNANTPINFLNEVISKNIRLFDYESIRIEKNENDLEREVSNNLLKIESSDDKNFLNNLYNQKSYKYGKLKKVINFSKIAGMAAVANMFKATAELLLSRKYSTPFIFSKLSYMYSDIEHMKESFTQMGTFIKDQYLGEEISPFIVGILGSGECCMGALEVLQCLPHEYVSPSELVELNNRKEKIRDKIFICVFNFKDIYVDPKKVRIGGQEQYIKNSKKLSENFDEDEFKNNPQKYYSIFKYYTPYISCVINCLNWKKDYRKILKKSDLESIVVENNIKLMAISDAVCEINGGIEILKVHKSFLDPFFIYEPVTKEYIDNVDESTSESIIYIAVPMLARSLAEDASIYFSKMLKKYIDPLVKTSKYYSLNKNDDRLNTSFDEVPELEGAMIVNNGFITEHYSQLFAYSNRKEGLNEDSGSNSIYYSNIKLRGHIFDSGLFNLIIDDCMHYEVETKCIFMKIGNVNEDSSTVYINLSSKKKKSLLSFIEEIEKKVKSEKVLKQIIKTNIQ